MTQNMNIKLCAVCGKKFEKQRRNLKWWNLAKFCSNKCSGISKVGKPNGTAGKKAWNKGLKIKTNTGRTHFKKGSNPWNKELKGTYHSIWSQESKDNFKKAMSGSNHPNWNGGYKSRNKQSLYNPLYVEWRTNIFKRDNWKCMISDENCKGTLEAHHILPWSHYPELRYKINNGITLCHYHHPRKSDEVVKLAPVFQGMVNYFLAN